MKKWRCSVCGYIHEGDEPPDKCPVCGADKSMFELISDTTEKSGEKSRKLQEEKGNKKWRCPVCGYIDEESRPDKCPVCGSDKELFEAMETGSKIEIQQKVSEKKDTPEKKETPPEQEADKSFYQFIIGQILKHHVHPVSVHIPNGVIPVSVIFIVLAMISGCKALATAALCNMIFVVLAMPLVIFTGYTEWKMKYRGFLSRIFLTKILCATLVAITSLIVALWLVFEPDVLITSSYKWIFLFISFIMIGAAGVAGFIGGKLVFKD